MRSWPLLSPVLLVCALVVLPRGDLARASEGEGALTIQEATAAVLAAIGAKDDEALHALAVAGRPDPWEVVDELCHDGHHDEAEALVKAAARPDNEQLLAYIAAWRLRAPDSEDSAQRERHRALDRVYDTDLQAVIEGTATLPAPPLTVTQVNLHVLRGYALQDLGRREEYEASRLVAAAGAERLGWLSLASLMFSDAGRSAVVRGDVPAAVRALERSRELSERRGHALDHAQACYDLGCAHGRAREFDKAMDAWRAATSVLQGRDERSDPQARLLALTLMNMADLHCQRGDYAMALYHLQQAERLALALGTRGDRLLAGVHLNRGQALLGLNRFGDALDAFQELLRNWQDLGMSDDAKARALNNMALAHESLGEYTRARDCYQEALGLFGEGEVSPAIATARATARANLGNMHRLLGDWERAAGELRAALEQQEALDDEPGQARTQGHLGGLLTAQGSYREALGALRIAHRLFQAQGDRKGVARILGKQGVIDQARGRYPEALRTYEDALDALRELGDRAGAVEVLIDLGAVHQLLGDSRRARSRLQQALEEATDLGKRDSAASAMSNLGNVYQSLGRLDEALAMHERARASFADIGDRGKELLALGNIGVAQYALRRYEDAFRTYVEVLAATRASGDAIGYELARGNLGEVRQQLTGAPEPIASLEEHAELAREVLAESPEQLLKASAEELRNRRAIPQHVAVLGMLARHYLDTDRHADALATATLASGALEGLLGNLDRERGATSRAPHATLFAVGALAARRAGDASALAAFIERGRAGALLDGLEGRRLLEEGLKGLPPERAQALQRDLELAESERTIAAHAYGQALARGDAAEVEKALRARDAANGAVGTAQGRIELEVQAEGDTWTRRLSSVAEMQGALEQDQALVLYAFLEDRAGETPFDEALALVVRRDSVRVVGLGTASSLRTACERLARPAPEVAGHAARGAADEEEPGEEVPADVWHAAVERGRRQLIVPLDLDRYDPPVTEVIVSPDGLLGYVPFGLLLPGRGVSMTPSGTTSALLRQQARRRTRAGEGILALGNPDYATLSAGALANFHQGEPLAPLPASLREVEAVATVRLTGGAASEPALARLLNATPSRHDAWDALLEAERGPGPNGVADADPMAPPARRPKRWRALHFACHGLIHPEQPMLSALALSGAGEDDGFLTALEVLGLDMTADLAVLSACNSSRGTIVAGEGIVGFTRAFLLAGSARVICSLWKADDAATAALMIRFYELWNPVDGTPGMPTAQALQAAQDFVRGHEAWRAPYYWAGWTLWGLPD